MASMASGSLVQGQKNRGMRCHTHAIDAPTSGGSRELSRYRNLYKRNGTDARDQPYAIIGPCGKTMEQIEKDADRDKWSI